MDNPAIGPNLTDVFTALDYLNDSGLVTTRTADVEGGRVFVWKEIRDKFEMDAAYFHGNVPAVYFKEFESVDDKKLWEFHKSLWNHNRAPVLIAVLPHEIRVYNCFAPPPRTPGDSKAEKKTLLKKAPLQAIHQFGSMKEDKILHIQESLTNFRRRDILAGRFVFGGRRRFERKHRVDSRLLNNLRQVRDTLIKKKLDKDVANRLIGRSIFVRYLEDRLVFENSNYNWFGVESSFCDLLENSPDSTYKFFDDLSRRFNGDLFPVDDQELDQVKPYHLQRLGRFLNGEEMKTKQMYFWAYDFNCIPIELISAIYETFLVDSQKDSGAYYTPPQIVDFVLSEMIPNDPLLKRPKVLDPACGSGIFLVEAFRRLATLYIRSLTDEKLRFRMLRDLLLTSIYGVDNDETAVQVATFSCYLALLDSVKSEIILETVRLPNLRDSNMFVDDFFNTEGKFSEQTYDIIIGNPPWQRELTELAEQYVEEHHHPIGRKQIAQAFLWRVPTLLSDGGKACLLCPSKSILYNQSKSEKKFRKAFFESIPVTKIIDFSAFRRSLFKNAIFPMVAVFCQNSIDKNKNDDLEYIGLHPSPLSEALAGVVIYGDEIKRLSRTRIAKHPHAWKIALWGSPRDFTLIDDLRFMYQDQTLGNIIGCRNWLISEGVTIGRDIPKIENSKLREMRFVPTEAIEPLCVLSKKDCSIKEKYFHRPRKDKHFRGPLILVRGGVLSDRRLAAAFLPENALFKSAIIGISGPPEDSDLLKVICAFINSSISHYYHFLTSSAWGIERSNIQKSELENFPCAVPDEDSNLFHRIVELVDKIQLDGTSEDWLPELDKLVFEAYGLTSFEQQLVEDFMKSTIECYPNRLDADAFKAPLSDELNQYAESYIQVFEATTGGNKKLVSTVYKSDSSYQAVSFRLTPHNFSEESHKVKIESPPDIDDHLNALEEIATKQHGKSLYVLKNIKVFEGNEIHIVKPAERRFWTKSAAYNDADSTISELLKTNI